MAEFAEEDAPAPRIGWSPSTSSGPRTAPSSPTRSCEAVAWTSVHASRQRPRLWRPVLEACGATEERIAANSSRPSRPATPVAQAPAPRRATPRPRRCPPRPSPGSLAGGAGSARVQRRRAPRARLAELRLGAGRRRPPTRGGGLSRGPEQMATAVRRLAIASTIAGHAERAVTALEDAIDDVEPNDRDFVTARRRDLDARRAGRTRNPGPGGDGWSAAPRVSTGRRPASAWFSPASPARARGQRDGARSGCPPRGALADGRFAEISRPAWSVWDSFDLSIGLIAAESLTSPRRTSDRCSSAEAQAAILVCGLPDGFRRGLVALRAAGDGRSGRTDGTRGSHVAPDPARGSVRSPR